MPTGPRATTIGAPKGGKMKIRELMTKDVVSVQPESTLREAAKLLVDHRVSGLPVVRANEVIGVLSEADIVAKASGAAGNGGLLSWLFEPEDGGQKVSARTVGEAMSAPAITIGANRPVHEAARRMVTEQVNRLPVVEDGRIVGILTRADIVRAFARGDGELGTEIRDDILRRTFWVEPGQVTVTVVDGQVTLSGEVETDTDTEMLPIFVSRVPGVVAVHSELRVKPHVA
jgi:CBS domain-containing protein